MSKFKESHTTWEDAGMRIDCVKFDGVDAMSGDVADYASTFARALGARAISCETPVSKTRWFGEFAARHKMMVGYHGHANITDPEALGRPESWEAAMSYSRYNGPNTVWGEGDTPIRETLQLMKREKYPFQGTIEFEYKVPDGSDVMKEIGRCVEFCRAALV